LPCSCCGCSSPSLPSAIETWRFRRPRVLSSEPDLLSSGTQFPLHLSAPRQTNSHHPQAKEQTNHRSTLRIPSPIRSRSANTTKRPTCPLQHSPRLQCRIPPHRRLATIPWTPWSTSQSTINCHINHHPSLLRHRRANSLAGQSQTHHQHSHQANPASADQVITMTCTDSRPVSRREQLQAPSR